jgi:Zn-dependent protease
MRWSYYIGSLFGFPIRVHISLLIFLAIVLLTGGGVYGLVLMIAVFASVILHELGHALVARSRGMKIVDISLYPFGGMARMATAPRTTRDEIFMAAAGPAVSLLLAAAFGVPAFFTGNYTLGLLARINLLLGAFNLLPALPMDGGRIFRAFLARKLGFYRATTIAARVARWLALALAVFGLFYSGWFLVLAAFLLFMAFAEEGAARARQYMGDPGYSDTPPQTRPVFDPFRRFAESAGFRVPGSDWEVLDPDQPAPSPGNRRVYEDKNGNRIVVEWRDGGP